MPGPYAYDPELAPYAEMIPRLPEPLDHRPEAAVELRAYATTMLASVGYDVQDHGGLTVEDERIHGLNGAPDVPLRIYRQEGLEPGTACVIWIHGGGYCQGSIYEGPSTAAIGAQRIPLVFVDVEYRLAPEHPAPAAIEDCYTALKWVFDNGAKIGIDPDRIIVVGSSAGGGLAASLSLMTRDFGGPTITFVALSCPELDDRLETVSMRDFTDTPMFYRSEAERSWDWYLGGAHNQATSPFAVPSRREDLAGLPPTYIAVSEFDPLRDEGIAYASQLLRCGVSVELHLFPGTFHGSGIAAEAAVTRRQFSELDGAIAKAAGVAL